jgi:hypothetical protein
MVVKSLLVKLNTEEWQELVHSKEEEEKKWLKKYQEENNIEVIAS